MKTIKITVAVFLLCAGSAQAQFSRLHVKPANSSTVGITTGGSSNKVIGLAHDGTAGTISTTTVDGSTANTPLRFATSGQTRMTIFENGFVGIGGTGSPSAELTVAGKVHAREVKVNVAAGTGPDYVFADHYELMPLATLSKFLQEHKHLPQVPTAVEMETNGVNISEMNMTLLKKVEELTLYLIDQNKKMEQLSAEVTKLQAELNAIKEK